MKEINTNRGFKVAVFITVYVLVSTILGLTVRVKGPTDIFLGDDPNDISKITDMNEEEKVRKQQEILDVIKLEASLTNKKYFVNNGKKISRKNAYSVSLGKISLSVEKEKKSQVTYGEEYWRVLHVSINKRQQQVEKLQKQKEVAKQAAEEKRKEQEKAQKKHEKDMRRMDGGLYYERSEDIDESQEVIKVILNNLNPRKKYIFSMEYVQYLKNSKTKKAFQGNRGKYGPVVVTNTSSRSMYFYTKPTASTNATIITKMTEEDQDHNLNTKTTREREKTGSEPYDWDITIRLNGAIVYKCKRGKAEEYNFVRY